MIGSKIREYKIISILGKGGMGTVFLAEHENLGKFAFKMLAPELSANEQFRARFIREAQAQLSLKHENIVTLNTLMIDDERLFIVEEYIDGCSLADILKDEKCLSRKRTISILCQILQGLGYAHDKGIIHRDLKPANILVTRDHVAKVADFGIALIVGDHRLTQTGTTMGTAHYMSPEQIRNPQQLDHRTDIYAAGIMLFEMLAGHQPFDATNVFDIFHKHLHEPPPDLPGFSDDAPSGLPAILARTLAKEPANRYEFCYELAYDLEQCLNEREPGMKETTSSDRRAGPAGAYEISEFGHPPDPVGRRPVKQAETHSETNAESVVSDIADKVMPFQSMASNVFPLKPIPNEKGSPIRSDIEGELILVRGTESQYAKVLSLDVAWHMELFETLPDDFANWCSSVEQDFNAGSVIFTYLPDIKPLDLQQIRSTLCLDAPMIQSRIARLVLDLSSSLKKVLLESGVPQLLIHPERLSLKDDRFSILPTLSGPLPPLSQLTEEQNLGWLIFTPPELLRTRFSDPGLSPAAEIFSLGRTLQVIAAGDWMPPVILDGLQYIKGVVEDFEWVSVPSSDIAFDAFFTFTQRMTAPMPEHRPNIEEVIDQASQWVEQFSPEEFISGLIRADKLEDAGRCIHASAGMNKGPFAMEPKTVCLLQADLELARSPREHAKAIDLLNRAIRLDPADPELHVRVAEGYEDFLKHAQHRSLSSNAFKQAARLSNWRRDIVDRWIKLLADLEPARILQDTQSVPMDARPELLYLLRCKALVEQGKVMEAWNEMVGFFSRFPADSNAYHAARAAAAGLPPLILVKWMHENKDRPGLAALVAIAWERNGNEEKAKIWRKRAGL